MDEPRYWRTLSAMRATRRRLLRSGTLLAAGSGVALLIGCGQRSSGRTSNGTTGGGSAPSGTPQRGGVLAGRVPTDPPTTWIPAGAITYNSVWPYAPAYNQLVQWDPQDADNKIIPDLADSYEITGDGRSIVFRLHPGVKFHDGSDFTSEDAKATIDWTLNPPPKMSASQQGVLSVIDHVETPDPLTAKFVLKQPNPSLLGTLASHFGAVGAKADLAKPDLGSNTLNGTGPFKLKSITRGVGVELERNPNYWVKDRPYLDGVKFSVIADDNTAMTDLIGGQLHRYFPVIPDNVGRATRETGGKCKDYDPLAPNRSILFFNSTKKPFNDPRVRQAVSLVLDRTEAMQIDVHKFGALGGYMQPGGKWAISDSQRNTVPGYQKPDIAEAKKLLAAAGVTEPQSGTLMTRSDTTFQPATIYVQGALQKNLGWNYRLDVKDSAAAFAAAAGTQFDMLCWIFGLTFDDPDATFGQLATATAASNWGKVADPDADALFAKQSQTMDEASRKPLVQELELKYLNDFSLVSLYFRSGTHALWDTVQNLKIPSGIYVNQRYQDVWLTKA